MEKEKDWFEDCDYDCENCGMNTIALSAMMKRKKMALT